MEWNSEEQENTKKGMSTSSKILLAIIACLIVIIILLLLLVTNMKKTPTYSISVDGVAAKTTKEVLLTTIENETYVNIEEFAKLVGYEYHKGEYKSFTVEEDKCYAQGTEETASFYLNDNKVYKMPLNNQIKENYDEYTVESTVKLVNSKMYAPVDAILKAFNVVIDEKENYFNIYTLKYLIEIYDAKVVGWGYTSIAEQSFENQKSLLYGYLIVKKEGGLYKIIDLDNTKEITLARYTSIEFLENVQKFLVKDSSNKAGILDFEGKTEIEQNYESIEVLDKESNLYLVKQTGKYGVVEAGNSTIIFPEYTSIGINNSNISMNNKYLILDTLIPVYNGKNWGAYDKNGNLILAIEYDDFGYSLNNAEIDGIKKAVLPIIEIERCNGIVVKKDEKYGVMDFTGKELVPIAVDSIYAVEEENENSRYFMVYNGKELNVIERLIKAGLLTEENNDQEENLDEEINNNIVNNNVTTDTENENNLMNDSSTTTQNNSDSENN